MGVTLITGHSGAGHITSADAGRLIAGVVGLDRYVLPTGKKFAYTIISNNEIDIADGDLVDQGRHITLPQNEVEVVQIENGEQNKERIDTIAIKYTMDASSGIESASMVLKKGTPVTIGSGTAAPAALTTGNIYAGATEDETALYYVYISGITITKVVQSFVVRESLAVLKSDITALNNGLAQLYPVGSIYLSVNDTNPSTFIGGTWERIKDRFLLAAGDSYAAGSTGGEAQHTLIVQELPRGDVINYRPSKSIRVSALKSSTLNVSNSEYVFGSNYDLSVAEGAGHTLYGLPHNNMPPYIAVYMWVRTA